MFCRCKACRAGGVYMRCMYGAKMMFVHEACVVHECLHGKKFLVFACLSRCGAWMFAKMLIHFHFGKFLHHPYVLLLGKVMPNFSGDDHACVFCVCIFLINLLSVFLLYMCIPRRLPWSSA